MCFPCSCCNPLHLIQTWRCYPGLSNYCVVQFQTLLVCLILLFVWVKGKPWLCTRCRLSLTSCLSCFNLPNKHGLVFYFTWNHSIIVSYIWNYLTLKAIFGHGHLCFLYYNNICKLLVFLSYIMNSCSYFRLWVQTKMSHYLIYIPQ